MTTLTTKARHCRRRTIVKATGRTVENGAESVATALRLDDRTRLLGSEHEVSDAAAMIGNRRMQCGTRRFRALLLERRERLRGV